MQKGNIGLRQMKKEDKYSFIKWHNDENIRHQIGGIFPFTDADFKKIISHGLEEYPQNIWFSICKNGKLIGIAGLHNIKYIQKNAECAIFIGEKEERQQKYGSIVLKMIEDYAFGILSMHRIYAKVFSYNTIAKKFFEKNGWEKEGTMKDAFYWKFEYYNIDLYAKIEK